MVFTSPRPPAPVPNTSLTGFVLRDAARYPDRVAVTDLTGRTAYTYGELVAGARRAATGLYRLGFRQHDVLAVLAPNVPEYAIAYHAAAIAGGVVVALNPLDTVDDLAEHLDRTGARFLVTMPDQLERAAELAARTKVTVTVVFGDAAGASPFAELLACDAVPWEPDVNPAQDVVTILHSSGSTGFPKGVQLTHRNMTANVLQTILGVPLGEHERVLAVPPFHHAFGLIMVLNASLAQGATIVTMPRFEPEAYLRAIQDHRITRLYVVPTIAVLLARSPLVDRYDLSSLRQIVSGGAALDPAVARQCRQRLGCEVGQGYGLTEALVSFMQFTPAQPSGSVGPSTTNVECRIVDVRTGRELGRNQDGEILIRGPHVMQGYLDAPDATRDVLEPDGFLHTGDLGHIDDDGELTIVDRIKELIKYKGQQVSPVELEAVLMTHPKVGDVAVIGVPDDEASEVPKAFVVAGEPVSAEDILAFVAERVAPYKKVRQVEFVDRIPRTPVGKIERRSLKERKHAI